MKRRQLIVLHIVFWGLLFISNIWSSYSRGLSPFVKVLIIEAGYFTIPITCFYSSYLFVAPQLFVKKRYLRALLYALLTLMAIVILRYVLEYYFFKPVLGFDNYKGHPWPVGDYIENVFFYYFPRYFIYGLMYFFAESWYKTRHLQQQIEKERSAAELAFLRSQVNPHFLFNSINDIYSLTYQKSEQAPAALLKLSDILRYMLREDGDSFTPLIGEIGYVENVIDLQRISAKGGAFINFKVEGPVENQKVASLIFIPFAENAFKHGVLNDAENPVEIALTISAENICFAVSNKKSPYQKDHTGGIGLNNVKRRLELLYPGKHELAIDDKEDFYTVKLNLQR